MEMNLYACSAGLSGDRGAKRKLRVEQYTDFTNIPVQDGQCVSRQQGKKKDDGMQKRQVERDCYQHT